MFINDVGENDWEEIDLGQAARNYGFPAREGPCAFGSVTNCGPPPPGYTNPIFWYHHNGSCSVISGGAFVPRGIWPSAFDGGYVFADFGCGSMWTLTQAPSGYSQSDFDSGLSAVVDLGFGPTASGQGQALYYTSYASGVHRISFQPGAGYRDAGPLTCQSGSPRLSEGMPVVFARSASADFEFVAASSLFLHWNGASWDVVPEPWLISYAFDGVSTYHWWTTTGAYAGSSATVAQTLDTNVGGYWLAVQEIVWFSADGTLLAVDVPLSSPTHGPNAVTASPLCYWGGPSAPQAAAPGFDLLRPARKAVLTCAAAFAGGVHLPRALTMRAPRRLTRANAGHRVERWRASLTPRPAGPAYAASPRPSKRLTRCLARGDSLGR